MNSNREKIAVVGMACRFPGARNLNEYWNNLIEGRDTIKHFTDNELSKFEVNYDELKLNPDYVKARGVLEDIDKFDAGFFGMTPKEAAGTDPQHRVWLETAWEAFENAGCDPITSAEIIGVFAGGYVNTYLLNNILRDPDKLENYIRLRSTESFQILTGNDIAFLPTKTAYKFNLRGPAINVQTACSTSLVAISQACQSLFSFETDICLAGGVCIVVPQETGYLYQEGAIPSPDGVCRSFDAKAKGTVFSNGVGAVVLKRMDDAIRDRDTIYALVSGWALNNDGNNKVSYSAPSINGQAEVIMMAQSFAEISPEQIAYIEAHGTATQLGDPVEIAGLTKAFSRKTDKKEFCGIGSVKSNIGHTDAAAGVASFIKACLSAYHRKIPASINFSRPNEHINFENTPFFVQSKLKEWTEKRPLIMGVSSFGIGGTNAHVILEEPPRPGEKHPEQSEWPDLILLSAKNEDSLSKKKLDLAEFINSNPETNIKDVSYTLAKGRSHMVHRSFCVSSNTSEINANSKFIDGKRDDLISKITFIFPGQGAQYVSMGRDLYHSNNFFRQILDECFEIVKAELNTDLKSIIFGSDSINDAEEKLSATQITQPALFIIEYALARLLEQINIKPDYLVGHSIGEYTAACIAGVFDLHSALRIVCKRGQLMNNMPEGQMLAVQISYEKLQELDNPYFEIAAVNSPGFCTISFKTENTEKVKELLDDNDIGYITLNTSHAFHSATFDPILSEFMEFVDRFEMKPPEIPFVSCLTGKFITSAQATSGSYWSQQLRSTVLFRDGVSLIAGYENSLFLEVGPNTHLSSLVRANKISNRKAIIPTLGKPGGDKETHKIVTALGNMYNMGVKIDLPGLDETSNVSKISLPTYPFKRSRHWIDFNYPTKAGFTATEDPHTDFAKTDIGETTGHNIAEDSYPSGNVTKIIHELWQSMIGTDKIDPDDDFFQLGGHSLLALQIITRIKEVLKINIDLKTFLENPTINELSQICEEQSALSETEDEPDLPVNIKDLPLSDNQYRLWIISKIYSSNPAYNIPFTYHFTGNLNIEVFKKSLNVLFRKHFVMFSVFRQKDDKPYCEIVPGPVVLEFIDFSDSPAEKSSDEIFSFIGENSRKTFNIETGPLYRLYLIKQNDSSYYFHATIHHLVFDGWSWSVFILDFKKIYESLFYNKKVELEEVGVFYSYYLKWLENPEKTCNEASLTNFWIDNLKGSSFRLNFPYDFPRKNIPSGFGEKEDIRLSPACTRKLREISRKENATLFATLLSAIGILFQRYSGDNDICIGIPVAYRPHSKLEKIFGLFVNTVPLRLKVDEKVSFNKFINYTKTILLEAISHQELPFEKIVEALNPERSANINPLFQISVVWISQSTMPIDLPGAIGKHVNVRKGVSPFDITFYLWENGDNIEGEIEYNIDILKPDTIIRLRDNFISLINNLVENPEPPVDNNPMISDNDRKTILGFTHTKADYPKEKTIVQLFEEQVHLYPKKTAVVFNKEILTYKQLHEKTNQLARTLRSMGVYNNSTVGLLVEKSADMIVGILGILKAGGAYVPIDPEYPEQRINFMIRDAGCKILLTQKDLLEIPVEGVTKLDLNSGDTYHKDMSALENINSSSDLAYIMYTSGTTGVPKGSLIQQYSVVRLVRNTNYIELTSNDRILLTGAIVFDATTFEIWGALLNGGSLYLVEKETILDAKALGKELLKNNITTLWLTSPLFTQIAEIRTDIFSKLKYLLVGGDVLSAHHINKVRKDNPHLKVINGYGPTENTTFSTTFLIEKDFDQNIPIGKPVSNSTAYILDKYLNYQPIGVIGELYLGGDGLSKGYLNREDLNKSSFIDHPHIPGERLYKTGDRARWLADGNIEFHGRIDTQLKIRGFRVELEEIESAICELEGVIETVVKPFNMQDENLGLVAFLNISHNFSRNTKEITSQLKKKLPLYMMPSAFNLMNGFPKTINGKTDKNALTFNPGELEPGKIAGNIKELSKTEKVLFQIWSDALKITNLSITDNFFDIGGNSLMAISVFSKIESEFNIDIGLRVFFDSPRIKDLAETIELSLEDKTRIRSISKKKKPDLKIIKGEI